MPLSDAPERTIPDRLVLLVKFYACPGCGGQYRTESLCPEEIPEAERWTIIRPMLDQQAHAIEQRGCDGCGARVAPVPVYNGERVYR